MSNIVNFKKPEKKSETPKPSHPSMINLPPVTKALLMIMIIIHLGIMFFADNDMRAYIFLNFGYIPSIWTGQNAYGFDTYAFISPLTYMFLHGTLMHILMNGAMLMAFGAGVEKWMGSKKFLIFFILCGLCAVLVETIIHPFSTNPVIGASGAESGLFAAILILLHSQGRLPTGKYGIWPFAAFWIGLSLLIGLVDGAVMGGKIAWATHLGGFIAGFGLLKLKYFRQA